MQNSLQRQILVVDDNKSIHEDFTKIFSENAHNSSLREDEDEAILFGKPKTDNNLNPPITYRLDSAYQGHEALELVKKSLLNKTPYSLAFVDMLMPPGWNGLETTKQLWAVDPNLQIVICSAYSDYTWEDIDNELNHSDN